VVGSASGGSHLATRRIERRGAGRVRVGETLAAIDELEAARLPSAGIGSVLEQRSERLGESQMRSSDWMGDR
jgi:hypothetical protein